MLDAMTTTANLDNMSMMHHTGIVNLKRSDVTCPPGLGRQINPIGLVAGGDQRFFATGNERTQMIMPEGYGYQVRSKAQRAISDHLMNINHAPRAVYFKLEFTWVPSDVTKARPRRLPGTSGRGSGPPPGLAGQTRAPPRGHGASRRSDCRIPKPAHRGDNYPDTGGPKRLVLRVRFGRRGGRGGDP
ncbi:MAG TPA: hypothetical protein VFS43_27475 [Polyangiaceae bacterium]|nr:hypothetical protein [Polyangiaceae bacterium]